ncbi:MAG: Stk1 family PASTA domain-containing Ser/Thr kinase [Clostridia bacterium]|nr:Stk1 family PASTA domain-containing Ser/Thr kinase [Clostridia bacterium]
MMIGTVIANRYEIIEEVGKGGMAVVYKAKCLVLNRYVALKVLRQEFREDTDFIHRFKVEAQSAGSLSHPNIVSIYDVCQSDGVDYIVMEYVEGVTLKEYIEKRGIIPWKEAVDYAAQICAGLEHAHKKGIIHKDIKPHNVIITREGTLKITDFGIAKVMSTSTIATGGAQAMGSVHYFSPEQARGGYTDAKTDIYSLGVLMYEMVTGRLPFEGDTAVAVAMQHIEKEPTPPTKINPSVDTSLENVILRAMSKEQARRYDSATKMMIDLKKVYMGTPVSFDPALAGGETTVLPPIGGEHVVPKELRGKPKGSAKPVQEGKGQKTPEQERKDKISLIAGIATGVGLFVILALIFYFMFFSPASVPEVELPNFKNMTVEEARALVKDTELQIVVSESVESHEVKEGDIISQDPTPDKKVKNNATIRVVVSLGAPGGEMPELVGRTDIDAQDVIRRLGLVPNVVSEPSDTVAKGNVIRHTPPQGTRYNDGDMVTIYVSSGQENATVPVPNLIGLTEEEAKSALLALDLTWGTITKVESSRPEGTVVQQSIAAETNVGTKTSVSLRISGGKNSASAEPTSTPKPTIRPIAPNS